VPDFPQKLLLYMALIAFEIDTKKRGQILPLPVVMDTDLIETKAYLSRPHPAFSKDDSLSYAVILWTFQLT
jgi:hypothetical protein